MALPAPPATRRRARSRLARHRRPGRLDDAGHRGPAPLHERPDAVRGRAAGGPRRQPDRALRALVRAPGGVDRPARRPPRRGGRERADRPAQRPRGRDQQGFASRRRVRRDGRAPARHEHAHAQGRQVVRRHATSRTRTSGGTAGSPGRSSCTPPARSTWPTSGPTRASPTTARPARSSSPSSSGSRAVSSSRAGPSRPGSTASTGRSGPRHRASTRARSRAGRSTTSGSCSAPPPGCRSRTPRRRRGRPSTPGWPRRATGSSAGAWRCPGSCPGRRSDRRSTACRWCSAAPDGGVAERAELRIGFRRVEIDGLDLLVNGAPGVHPRRQPPRLRPAHGADRQPRPDAGRPRPDEAVRVQRGADVALPERPGVPRPDRRARAVRRRRGRHRVARVPEHAVRRPALPRGVGRPRVADGDPRQEPPVGDPLVARERVRPRPRTTRRRRPGSGATTRRGRSTTRARSASTGRATRASAT